MIFGSFVQTSANFSMSSRVAPYAAAVQIALNRRLREGARGVFVNHLRHQRDEVLVKRVCLRKNE